MADPKGTYYGPSETGWATVLRPGPNFMGLAMQNEAIKARREQAALAQKQKADLERERQVSKIVGDLSKPVPTAFPYQEQVTKMKDELLKEVQEMYFDNKDAASIRFRAATGVQELAAYANSGKQVYEGILTQTKQLDQKKYKIEEINKGLAEKIIGVDGKIIDPSKVDQRDLSATELVYNSEKPWEYLNENVVVKDFMKNDAFKETAMEIQRNIDAGRIGRFTQFNTQTVGGKAAGKIYDINPVSGEIKINDPETLIKNGAFQLMLADRDMAAVVDGYVAMLTADRNAPLDEDQKDILRASVLQDILQNNAPGPQTIDRVRSKYMPTNVSSGSGRLPQWMQQEAAVNEGTTVWESDATSRSLPLVKEAIMFSAKKGGISTTSLSPIHELTGANPESEITNVTFTRPGALEKSVPYTEMDPRQPWADRIPDEHKLFIEFKKPGSKYGNWVEIDQRSLSDERTRAALNKLQEGVGYGYKQRSPNPVNPNTVGGGQQQQTKKKFSIFENK